jgi:hypothetical protein
MIVDFRLPIEAVPQSLPLLETLRLVLGKNRRVYKAKLCATLFAPGPGRQGEGFLKAER